jgi:hypothetical protein
MNLKRALWATTALNAFETETGTDTPEDTISDLICDIGHFCDAKGLDFLQLVVVAVGNWKLEQDDPESMGTPPDVEIRVGA